MSTQVGSIHYDLKLDTSSFDKSVARIGAKTRAIGDEMTSIGKSMTVAITLPVALGLGFAIKSASDLQETLNKVDVSFKDQSATVKAWANTSIKSMGLAKSTALDIASVFGDMGTAMGFNTKQASEMAMSLTQLAGDLASFKNISFDRAQIALAGVYTGETEALKGLGIVMTEANLEAFALSRGITKNLQDMTQAEKVSLRYAYVMDVTKNAQGDFARTADSTANQIRQTKERFKELSAELGDRFLPYVNKILEKIKELIDKFSSLSPKQQNIAIGFVLIAGVLGPLLIIMGSLVSSIGVLLPLLANPVFLALAGILVVLAGATYLVWKNWDTLKDVFAKVNNFLKPVYDFFKANILPILKEVWTFIGTQFKKAWEDLRQAFGKVKTALEPFAPQLKQIGIVMLALSVAPIAIFIATLVTVTTIIALVISFFARLIGWVSQLIAWFYSLAGNVSGAMGQFASAVWNGINSVVSWYAGLPGRILGVLGNLGGLLWGAGQQIIDGLVGGINSRVGGLMNRVGNIAGSVASAFKSAMGIRSPSKVFFGFGENINEGLAKGLMSNQSVVADAVGNMATTTINSGTNIYGNVNIRSQQDADYFFNRINRDQELLGLGLAQ